MNWIVGSNVLRDPTLWPFTQERILHCRLAPDRAGLETRAVRTWGRGVDGTRGHTATWQGWRSGEQVSATNHRRGPPSRYLVAGSNPAVSNCKRSSTMPAKGGKEGQRAYQRQWIARRRAAWFAGKWCERCWCTTNLELDHLDQDTKISNSIWSWSESRRQAELKKCRVLCKWCHAVRTILQSSRPDRHGTSAGWRRGCRCCECRKAHYEDCRKHREANREAYRLSWRKSSERMRAKKRSTGA